MKKFEIVFRNEVEHESIEDCYEAFLDYLADCVKTGDVSVFQFYQMEESTNE
tara:strand:- start:1697 stop:1852 length:156 start_codon:yes stop_codon:yes gene_type:complete